MMNRLYCYSYVLGNGRAAKILAPSVGEK